MKAATQVGSAGSGPLCRLALEELEGSEASVPSTYIQGHSPRMVHLTMPGRIPALPRLVLLAPAGRPQLYLQPRWGRRGPGQFWSTQAVSTDMCFERHPTNHAQCQQMNLEISLLPSLSHVQEMKQRQASVFEIRGHENTWHTLSDSKR